MKNDSLTEVHDVLSSGEPLAPAHIGQIFNSLLKGVFIDFSLALTSVRFTQFQKDVLCFSCVVERLGPVSKGLTRVPAEMALFDLKDQRHVLMLISLPMDLSAAGFLESCVLGEGVQETMADIYLKDFRLEKQAVILSSLDFGEDLNRSAYSASMAAFLPVEEIRRGLNLRASSVLSDGFPGFFQEMFTGLLRADLPGHAYLLLGNAVSSRNFPLLTGEGHEESDGTAMPCPWLSLSQEFSGSGLSVGPVRLVSERLQLMFPLGDSDILWPEVVLAGSVDLGGTILKVEAELNLYHRILRIDFRSFPSLGHLIQKAGFGDESEFLPDVLHPLLGLTLSDLYLSFDFSDASVLEVGLEVRMGSTLALIPGAIELNDAGLALSFLRPFSDSRSVAGSLTGKWQLGDKHFLTTMTYPDMMFGMEMAEGESISISDLAAVFGRIDILPGGVSVVKLALAGSLTEGGFQLALTIDSSNSVSLMDRPPLQFKELLIEMRYSSMVREFSAAAELTLGGIAFDLSAVFQGTAWEFRGSATKGQKIPLGLWIGKISAEFGSFEPPEVVKGAIIEDVEVMFNTGTRDFHFSIGATIPVGDGKDLALTLTLELVNHGEDFEKKFAGQVELSGRRFDLVFDSVSKAGRSSSGLVASFLGESGGAITLAEMLRAAGVDAEDVPDLSVSLKSAFFALEKTDANESWRVFGLNLGAGLDLAGLPLIGKVVPPGMSLSLQLQALYSSQQMKAGADPDLIGAVNARLPPGATPLPSQGNQGDVLIEKGPALAATLHLGSTTIPLSLPVGLEKDGKVSVRNTPKMAKPPAAGPRTEPAAQPRTAPVSVTEELKWFTIQKSFGPAHFERVGAGYAKGEVTLEVDASVSLGPVTLSLDGLGVSSPISQFEPVFRLRGIGLDFSSGGVEIGGSFLRLGEDSYAGSAVIRAKALTLSAIGAYEKKDGRTSVFLYAVLEYPLGGPSFFFVTGLAAGFGYNRELKMPDIGALQEFPLIARAVPNAKLPVDAKSELASLREFIPPLAGQYFLAVGIRFNSFKLIDSFALLAVSFGQRFEIDVLGLATLQVPADIDSPLARVRIALIARFVPSEGLLAVDARITPDSYLLSPDCHLSGGFAFYTWFAGDFAGDFVVTLGGYHPLFQPPPHYPRVPRAGFNWQVVPGKLVIKGDAYYALTSHALMAGGHLEASYSSGPLKAWFKAGADFLISWQPYRYDAHAYIDVGGSYDTGAGTITVDLSADLHLFGPEFAGTAELDLYITTVHVTFGQQPYDPPPRFISWPKFAEAFLPAEEKVLGIALEAGLLGTAERSKEDPPASGARDKVVQLGTVNPKELRLVTNSLIPLSEWQIAKTGAQPATHRTGIAPVNVPVGGATVTHVIRIERDGEDVSEEFQVTERDKLLPAALWGAPAPEGPSANLPERDRLIRGTSGVALTPAQPAQRRHSSPMRESALTHHRVPSPLSLQSIPEMFVGHLPPDGEDARRTRRQVISSTILDPEVVRTRNARLKALGLDPAEVRLGGFSGTMFSAEPALGRPEPLVLIS